MSLRVRIIGCLIIGLIVSGLGYERMVNAGQEFHWGSSKVIQSHNDDRGTDQLIVQEAASVTPSKAIDTDELLEIPIPPNYETLFLSRENERLEAPTVKAAPQTAPVVAETEPVETRSDLLAVAPTLPIEIPIPKSPSPIATPPQEHQVDDQFGPQLREAAKASAVGQLSDTATRRVPDDGINIVSHRRYLDLVRRLPVAVEQLNSDNVEGQSIPDYPLSCLSDAQQDEFVIVKFRVNSGGWAALPQVVQTTNDCFNTAAVRAARATRFGIDTKSQDVFGQTQFALSYVFQKPGDAQLYE